MRMIHPVAAHEKPVARGEYLVVDNDSKIIGSEAWSMNEVPGGALLVRTDQDMRQQNQTSRLFEILQVPDGRIERMIVQVIQHTPGAAFHSMRVDYTMLDRYVQVSRQVDNQEREYFEIEAPRDMLVRMLDVSVYWGATLRLSMAEPRRERPLFIPFLKPGMLPGQVLVSELPEVVDSGEEEVEIGERTVTALRCTTEGGRIIWLDVYDIPLQILNTVAKQRHYLTNYSHR